MALAGLLLTQDPVKRGSGLLLAAHSVRQHCTRLLAACAACLTAKLAQVHFASHCKALCLQACMAAFVWPLFHSLLQVQQHNRILLSQVRRLQEGGESAASSSSGGSAARRGLADEPTKLLHAAQDTIKLLEAQVSHSFRSHGTTAYLRLEEESQVAYMAACVQHQSCHAWR